MNNDYECQGTKARCRCNRSIDHDGPHICDCRGSWGDNGEVYAWPQDVVWDDEADE